MSRRRRLLALALAALAALALILALLAPGRGGPAGGAAAIPALARRLREWSPASAAASEDTATGPGLVVRVVDERGARVPGASVVAAQPHGEDFELRGRVFACSEARAPGFLATEVCADADAETWPPGERVVTLEAAVEVGLRCDDGAGPAPCTRGLYRCLAPGSPDLGRCDRTSCDCPEDADATVLAVGGAFRGEVATVQDGVATFRHTPPGRLTLAGAGACGAMLSRRVGDRSLGVVSLGTAACADGVATVAVAAGRYDVDTSEVPALQVRGVEVRAGQTTTLTLAPPAGAAVRLQGHPVHVTLRHGERTWSWLPAGDPLDLDAPPGAELLVRSEAGCCTWTSPQGALECTAARAARCPPIEVMSAL